MKKFFKRYVVIIAILLLLLLGSFIFLLWAFRDRDTVKPEKEKTEQVKEEPEEEEPYVVGQEVETIKGKISPFKYGVKKQPVTYNTYDVYSDGSRVLVKTVDDMLYYHTGYNATMEELKAESDLNVTSYLAYYEEVVRLVNEERAKVGVAPVTLDTTLCQVAGLRAAEIEYSGKYAHERPDGSGCFKVTQAYGIEYKYLAENIAQGYSSPKSAVKAWKGDPTDYSYMINPKFTKLGVGFSNAGINYEWVQVFTN